MKRLLHLFFMLLCVLLVKGNPLPSPEVVFSELAFDSLGHWVLELRLTNGNKYIQIDSVYIKTNSGISRLKKSPDFSKSNYIVVRKDSLVSDLSINSESDSIWVNSFGKDYYMYNDYQAVNYGNLLTDNTFAPQKGQSIANFGDDGYWNVKTTLDNSPTLGVENDTLGMCGVMKGFIYDKNNVLVKDTNLYFLTDETYTYLNVKSDGSYSIPLYSRSNKLEFFICQPEKHNWEYNYAPSPGRPSKFFITSDGYTVKIEPIEYKLRPDSVIYRDIHLTDSLKSGIENHQLDKRSFALSVYPNPIKNRVLRYNVSLPVVSSNCSLEVCSLNGQTVFDVEIFEANGVVQLPKELMKGIYLVNLKMNGRVYGTSKINIIER
ncbi:MAG: T9SS type A sorting domain-containing protein [Bacteroidales bacterium]|nr:T9SS type A sorting domain-containing protein [Bacteroidales bacterium]